MTGLLACLSAAVLGVDYGWQPVAGGGIEYIIQIEPQMLDALKEGEDVSSALPPAARSIRRYRIVVGNAPLPHHGEPLPIDAGKEGDAARETRSAEASPVRYDRFVETDAAAPKLSMPLESPYPRDYEATGIPLPGPAHAAPFARSWPASVVAEPTAHDVAAESDETGSPPVDQPAVEPNGPSLWTAQAKPSTNFSPLRKSPDAPPVKRQPPAESTQARTVAVDKPSPGERKKEPLSPSDQPPPKDEEHVSDQAGSAALVGLFASLGGNAFLIWVATGQRHRYRSLLRRSHEAVAAASAGELPRADDDSPRWEEVPEDED
ncbi:MAG TPA: hypothetical protein VN699_04585 [Pirellulales bacterium]|nr:hypothetical protein [Pirellulales bacterium]